MEYKEIMKNTIKTAIATFILSTSTSVMAGSAEDVLYYCKGLDSSGMLTKKCDVSVFNQSVDIHMNTTPSEARKMCPEIAAMDKHLGINIGNGWKLRILSPYGDSIATCSF